jgi:hypothetical protein
MATKILSIRVDDKDYKFLSSLAKEEQGDMSTAVRELVDLEESCLPLKIQNPKHPLKRLRDWRVYRFLR